MQTDSPGGGPALPAPLRRAPPRRVHFTARGLAALGLAVLLLLVAVAGGTALDRRARAAERHADLFASSRIVTAGEAFGVESPGVGLRQAIVRYRYLVRGRELIGSTAVPPPDAGRYAPGLPVAVWYLETEPEASWLDGYAPQRSPRWPGVAVLLVCGSLALGLILAIWRQANLLGRGHPALAVVTEVETMEGWRRRWRVRYEWELPSGTVRRGHYDHRTSPPPAVGSNVTVVYHHNNPFRHRRHPFGLVAANGR